MRFFRTTSSLAVACVVAVSNLAPAWADGEVTLGGGSPIVVVGVKTKACTLTAIGHDNTGNLVGITASYCGDRGDAVISESTPEAGTLGIVVKTNTDLAFSVLRFLPTRVTPTATVGDLTITGVEAQPLEEGDQICKLGRATGWTCGDVWSTNEVNHTARLCINKGDGGAPVVKDSKLVGMVTHYYFDTPCAGPEGGTNIGAILEAIGPGVGEGFTLQNS